MEPRPTVRRSHRRRRDARSPLLIGLVLVLLATVPVLVPLLVTRGGSTATVAPPGLAAQPGVPALPRSGEGAEPSGSHWHHWHLGGRRGAAAGRRPRGHPHADHHPAVQLPAAGPGPGAHRPVQHGAQHLRPAAGQPRRRA